jgi:hypothetical protein
VNHKNGNRTDNAHTNLEYVTRKQNVTHSYENLSRRHTSLRGDKMRNAVLSPESVRAIRARLADGEKQSVLAAEYGVNRQRVWCIAHNKWWKWA